VVLGTIGFVVGLQWWLAVPGAALSTAATIIWIAGTASRALGAIGVQSIPSDSLARLENLVEGFCVTNGIPIPNLAMVDVDACNAAVIGQRPDRCTLVITRGAIDSLTRIELEAVIARELALIRHGHAGLATVLAALAPLWAAAPQRFLPERADVVADMEAVGLTRYPPGLLDALAKVRLDPLVPSAARWTRHLWIEDPVAPADGRAGSFHSSIEERIATLREL
jgi:heat shock protein HtpX